MKAIATGYTSCSIVEDNSTVDEMSNKYALFPVWFMRFKYNGENYDFCVNGQTGEVAGQAPRSRAKVLFRKILAWVITILLYAVGGVGIAWAYYGFGMSALLGGIMASIGCAMGLLSVTGVLIFSAFPATASKIINSVKSKITGIYNAADDLDRMPDPYQYIDDRDGIVLKHKKDTLYYTGQPDNIIKPE